MVAFEIIASFDRARWE